MSKVLILANSSSGLYGFRNELVVELLKKYEVYASLPDRTNNEELESEGVKIIETPINRRGMNPLEDLKLFRTYLAIIKQTDPDVVLTYTIKPNVYGGMACRIKKVTYLSNITGLGSALENPGILQKLTKIMYKTGLKNAQTVFFQNSYNLGYFNDNKLCKAQKVLLPGSGVNVERFSVLPWPEDKTGFVFISRVMKEKGIEEFFECAKTVKSKRDDVEFHVLGYCEEGYEGTLKELNDKGVIIYHGSVLDVRPYLAQVKCIIHPSYHEGMSNVCLEAAACGRAVITTDRPGCRETVIDGESGYMVPARDKDALTNAVEKFLSLTDEEQKAMGDASRKHVEEKFDRNIVVEAYMNEIDKIIASKE